MGVLGLGQVPCRVYLAWPYANRRKILVWFNLFGGAARFHSFLSCAVPKRQAASGFQIPSCHVFTCCVCHRALTVCFTAGFPWKTTHIGQLPREKCLLSLLKGRNFREAELVTWRSLPHAMTSSKLPSTPLGPSLAIPVTIGPVAFSQPKRIQWISLVPHLGECRCPWHPWHPWHLASKLRGPEAKSKNRDPRLSQTTLPKGVPASSLCIYLKAGWSLKVNEVLQVFKVFWLGW